MARYRARNGLDILDFKHLVLALFVYTFHKFTLKASEPHFIQDLGVCKAFVNDLESKSTDCRIGRFLSLSQDFWKVNE